MSDPNFIILYVKNATESAAFYAQLLAKPALDAAPNFAMFALGGGLMLGLWAAHDVQPAATPVGGAELAVALGDKEAVRACHARWQGLGVPVIQAPTEMDFGFTFTALDPDGHRLRVFAPHAG